MYIVDEICHYCNISLPSCAAIIEKNAIDYYDFTFMLDGAMTYSANGRKYTISKNDAIFFPPGTLRWREEGNTPVRYVSFNFYAMPGISLPFREYMPNCITPPIRKIISAFPQSHLSPSFHSKEKCANMLNYILYELMDSEKVGSNNDHIYKIITYIDEHVCEKINLSTVSSYINLSKEYISAFFKKEMNITLTDYINEKKLSIAKELILGSEMRLSHVASYVGFENYNYFSRVFKKHFGTSPHNMKKFK